MLLHRVARRFAADVFLYVGVSLAISFAQTSFVAPLVVPIGTVGSLLTDDFNGDGKADFVGSGTDPSSSTQAPNDAIFASLGNGDGTFQPAIITTLGPAVLSSIAAKGDFNRDGRVDLVVLAEVTPGDNSVFQAQIWLGDGTGKFVPGTTLAVSLLGGNDTTHRIVTGDFDRDGKLDIISGAANLNFYRGNGDGTFAAPTTTATDHGFPDVLVSDLNGDGKLDVLADYSYSQFVFGPGLTHLVFTRYIVPFIGNGDGTFDAGPAITGDGYGHNNGFVAADFNGDGIQDFAKLNDIVYSPFGIANDSELDVYFGHGDGSFGAPVLQVYTNQILIGLAAIDVDNETGVCPELVTGVGPPASFAATTLALLPNNGSQFGAPELLIGGTVGVAIADFNGDGWSDLLTGRSGADPVLLLNTGGGEFIQPALNLSATGLARAAIADFNRDGTLDILSTDGQLRRGTTPLGFGPPIQVVDAGTVVSGDFNGDGIPDIAAGSAQATIVVSLGHGDGTFGAPVSYPVSANMQSLIVADFNKDGRMDLVGLPSNSDQLTILLGAGGGMFGAPTTVSLLSHSDFAYYVGSAHGFAVKDFNGDGNLDLAILRSDGIVVLQGSGTGTFTTQTLVTLPGALDPTSGYPVRRNQALLAADVTGDGKTDLVVGYSSFVAAGGTSFFAGNGNGDFAPETALTLLQSPVWLGLADATGDGLPDLMACNSSGEIAIRQGIANGTFLPPQFYLAGTSCDQLVVGNIGPSTGTGILNLGTDTISVVLPAAAVAQAKSRFIRGKLRR